MQPYNSYSFARTEGRLPLASTTQLGNTISTTITLTVHLCREKTGLAVCICAEFRRFHLVLLTKTTRPQILTSSNHLKCVRPYNPDIFSSPRSSRSSKDIHSQKITTKRSESRHKSESLPAVLPIRYTYIVKYHAVWSSRALLRNSVVTGYTDNLGSTAKFGTQIDTDTSDTYTSAAVYRSVYYSFDSLFRCLHCAHAVCDGFRSVFCKCIFITNHHHNRNVQQYKNGRPSAAGRHL